MVALLYSLVHSPPLIEINYAMILSSGQPFTYKCSMKVMDPYRNVATPSPNPTPP